MRNLKIDELTRVYGAGGRGKNTCSHGNGHGSGGSKRHGSKHRGSGGSKRHGSGGSKHRHCS